ncbi:MAG: site-2 protease family protein [Gemmatimonadaceae bacterium]
MDTLTTVLFVAPVLLYSVIAHEYAHGFAALRQGDPTAKELGRLTWNPVKHIDPFLTILMPLVMGYMSGWQIILGGAKPVPVNPMNYRNLRRGDIIVSLAGVATNLVLAFACTLLIAVFGLVGQFVPALGTTVGVLQVAMIFGVGINLILIAFNLIPIPPLDGSHVMKYLMPASWAVRYQQAGRFGFIILIVMLVYGRGFLEMWLRPALSLRLMLLQSVDGFFHASVGGWFR